MSVVILHVIVCDTSDRVTAASLTFRTHYAVDAYSMLCEATIEFLVTYAEQCVTHDASQTTALIVNFRVETRSTAYNFHHESDANSRNKRIDF